MAGDESRGPVAPLVRKRPKIIALIGTGTGTGTYTCNAAPRRRCKVVLRAGLEPASPISGRELLSS